MADHHHFEPFELEAGALEQLHRRQGGAGADVGDAIDDLADGLRMHALDVLRGLDRRLEALDRQVARQGALQNYAGDRGIGVEALYGRQGLGLAHGRLEIDLDELDADLGGGAALIAHIDFRGALVAEGDRHQPRLAARDLQFGHVTGDLT